MNKYIFAILIVALTSCQFPEKNYQILNDAEWHDALKLSISIAGINSDMIFLYQYYENSELVEVLSKEYSYGSEDFSYQINDSIIDYIKSRPNGRITNKLDTIFGLEFISDTIDVKHDYILLSKPFYIADNLLIYSMSYRKTKGDKNHHWIYYIQKQSGGVITKAIYDVAEDSYYEVIKP